MSIKRLTSSVRPDGSTASILPEGYLYTDLPCRLSFTSYTDNPVLIDITNPVRKQVKIFCDPTFDIKKGDFITVKKCDEEGNIIREYEGMTGNDPSVLHLNQEILFTIKEDA